MRSNDRRVQCSMMKSVFRDLKEVVLVAHSAHASSCSRDSGLNDQDVEASR